MKTELTVITSQSGDPLIASHNRVLATVSPTDTYSTLTEEMVRRYNIHEGLMTRIGDLTEDYAAHLAMQFGDYCEASKEVYEKTAQLLGGLPCKTGG